jgi:threonine/homoserine/homoserine lactone efflux protein
MDLQIWMAFTAATLFVLIIPGPTILLVMSYAISRGSGVALRMVAGVALGDFIAMTISLAGLGAVLAASATVFLVMKWVGGDLSCRDGAPVATECGESRRVDFIN